MSEILSGPILELILSNIAAKCNCGLDISRSVQHVSLKCFPYGYEHYTITQYDTFIRFGSTLHFITDIKLGLDDPELLEKSLKHFLMFMSRQNKVRIE